MEELLESKGPQAGSRVERERYANAITMVGMGMGDAWRAHGFPQHHYATIVLICQVKNQFAKNTLV
jgi:hypothetical protein